jgi:hypothetical protein
VEAVVVGRLVAAVVLVDTEHPLALLVVEALPSLR